MARIKEYTIIGKDKKPRGKQYWFQCPGCNEAHQYAVMLDGTGPSWTFNGDMEKPSFAPSLLNTSPQLRCHLFLTDGKIHFCPDCHHDLKGKTVDLPELPKWLKED